LIPVLLQLLHRAPIFRLALLQHQLIAPVAQ
jgi:hypothetical protein